MVYKDNKILKALGFLFLAIMTFVWLLPMIVAVLTSFRTNNELLTQGFLSFPEKVSFTSYQNAWTRGQLRLFLPNSFIITFPALIFTLGLSSLSAYALAKFRFKGRRLILSVFVGGMMLPFQILLLPVFRLSEKIGIYDTYWALIAIHTAFQLGFCTFVLRNYMVTIPKSLSEAARIDGCHEFRIYSQIIMPLVLPAVAAIATLEFTWIFNDYIWALILVRTSKMMPVTAGLAILQGQYVMDWTVIIAGALMATIPTIIVFIFLQRYFIQGLTMGSNK
ncbi:carbohydrate ABC transporter permease [Oceanispirochaeta sp.]|jgi:multiple sugar transport system permease protein|uniref:carbohydrate ABC transporter permease n=1 Tax=Oceanispirochaeta sp. TaxID=2035350 RepID=UPI0026133C28|nr:carbohydrate ABC transporter permease [Oceanispirochaeta sp.]MDA3958901.1 carbohydrate ABC transporter permease [Oceanispirochaeta sp.]